MMLIMLMKTTCIPEHLNDDVGKGVLVALHPVYLLARLHLLVTKNRQKKCFKIVSRLEYNTGREY
jgi:hypothetical protein